MHGIELVAVIARVKQDGANNPVHPRGALQPLAPEVLATLTFPGGKLLSPSLARWLARPRRRNAVPVELIRRGVA